MKPWNQCASKQLSQQHTALENWNNTLVAKDLCISSMWQKSRSLTIRIQDYQSRYTLSILLQIILFNCNLSCCFRTRSLASRTLLYVQQFRFDTLNILFFVLTSKTEDLIFPRHILTPWKRGACEQTPLLCVSKVMSDRVLISQNLSGQHLQKKRSLQVFHLSFCSTQVQQTEYVKSCTYSQERQRTEYLWEELSRQKCNTRSLFSSSNSLTQ